MISAQKRILGAFLIGGGLIAGAFLLAKDNYQPTGDLAVVSASAPRTHLKVEDVDDDGIPDWQEALQRTEPLVINPSETTYEAPDTLTDQFAREFFEKMVRSKGNDPIVGDSQQIIDEALSSYAVKATDEVLTTKDIIVGNDNSGAAVRNYINEIVTIQNNYPLDENTPNELVIFKEAVAADDKEALAQLDPIIAAYEGMLRDSKALSVPPDLASAHLDYLNALTAVGADITAFSQAFDDPLYSMLRLKRYQEDAAGLLATWLQLKKLSLEKGTGFMPTDAFYSGY